MFNTIDMWCILGRGTTNGCLAVGTIINLKLGLQPSRSARRATPPGRAATSLRTASRKAGSPPAIRTGPS